MALPGGWGTPGVVACAATTGHRDAQEDSTVRIAVLGSGVVGQTLAAKLAALGHDTMLGTRDVTALLARTEPGPMQQEPFSAWHQRHPEVALGSFAEAAAHAELVVNATSGGASFDALGQAGEATWTARSWSTWPTRSTSPGACRPPCRSPTPTRWVSRSSGPSPGPGWSRP